MAEFHLAAVSDDRTRDEIAMACMAAAMTNASGLGGMEQGDRGAILRQVGLIAYEAADALLAARTATAARK